MLCSIEIILNKIHDTLFFIKVQHTGDTYIGKAVMLSIPKFDFYLSILWKEVRQQLITYHKLSCSWLIV